MFKEASVYWLNIESQCWVQRAQSKVWSQKGGSIGSVLRYGPKVVSRVGSQVWVPWLRFKIGSKGWIPRLGPMVGSQVWDQVSGIRLHLKMEAQG
jgi:hypothetical protein